MNTSQLLCTFTNKKNLHNIIQKIVDRFNIIYNKIYVFSTRNENELICSYNIIYSDDIEYIDNTISVHRKKETNTLYSINALNYIIRNMNNGVLDTSIIIPWENYQNCLLVVNEEKLKKIDTYLYNIIYIKNSKNKLNN